MRDSSWKKQKRRKKDFTKALRKQMLCRQIYISEWYDNLHQYSKNKIHCSCGMCRFRCSWEPDRKPIADIRRAQGMKNQEIEYYKQW